MIHAFLHYADGTTLERVIPNIDRFKNCHLDDRSGASAIGHDFAYRYGQAEYLVAVHYDEVESCKTSMSVKRNFRRRDTTDAFRSSHPFILE